MRSAVKAHGAGAELRARVAHARETLAAPTEQFDPTPPGLLSKDPPGAAVELLEEMAADVRPENMTVQLSVMAEADQRDLLPGIEADPVGVGRAGRTLTAQRRASVRTGNPG